MENEDLIQKLQRFVLDHDLPRTDMALFGILCPYCGKSDRIRKLESPNELKRSLLDEDLKAFEEVWAAVVPLDRTPGVCKFCRQILVLHLETGKAEPMAK
jgi:hypothetical protein